MAMITEERLKLVRKFREEYRAMTAEQAKGASLEQWIMFRLSCTRIQAVRLLIAADQGVTTGTLMSRARRGGRHR